MSRSRQTLPAVVIQRTAHHFEGSVAACIRSLAVTALLSLATAVLVASPASAAVMVSESYEFPYSQVTEDFCGVEGLTVEQSGTATGQFRLIARGPNGYEYAGDTAKFSDTYTNVATGESVTQVGLYNGRAPLSITDNGDGTLTVIMQFAGIATTYDADGSRIAHTAALLRVEFLFDEDFNFIERVGIVKSAGTPADDFCTAVIQAIG